MKITTEKYSQHLSNLPASGQNITAHQNDEMLVVYQAYNHCIADFAIENQYLGGDAFSYSRMSWIKPNFLWMMYRCGWGEKENQERVLALWISKAHFDEILREAVFSSFNPEIYSRHEQWKNELAAKEVRLQWDPHHDPYGNKMEPRAVQLGLKGKILEDFGRKQIALIEDVTGFAKEQKAILLKDGAGSIQVPSEMLYLPADERLRSHTGIS